jgi:hypothetical protein
MREAPSSFSVRRLEISIVISSFAPLMNTFCGGSGDGFGDGFSDRNGDGFADPSCEGFVDPPGRNGNLRQEQSRIAARTRMIVRTGILSKLFLFIMRPPSCFCSA